MMATVTIEDDGSMSFIYSDELIELMEEGIPAVTRASHVEWNNKLGGWCADLSPVNGPVLGPHVLRKDALAAEVEWLHTHGF